MYTRGKLLQVGKKILVTHLLTRDLFAAANLLFFPRDA